jgi:TolB protein
MQNIVFDDGSDIYAAKADGSNVTPIANNPTILEGGSWFSPDGKRLVYFTIDDKNRVYGIWTMNPDGKNRINVASSEGSQIFRHPRWSPDGTRISFFTISKGVFNISVMNPDGSERVDLTSRSESPSRQASWSPSSKWLVYSRRSKNFDLWLMDTEGKNKMQLTHLPGHEAKPVWSLDGTKIAFLCSRCQRKGKSDLYLISRSR